MIPLIGLMYRTFGRYPKENLMYFEQSEKEIIEWVKWTCVFENKA